MDHAIDYRLDPVPITSGTAPSPNRGFNGLGGKLPAVSNLTRTALGVQAWRCLLSNLVQS
jgi:hypothetical protein